MEYHFMTLYFSDQRKIVRIHFDSQEYYALERFFNDDAPLLWRNVEAYWSQVPEDGAVRLAGNRSVITLSATEVQIEDQWENYVQGRFKPITLPADDFRAVYEAWKKEMEL